MALQPSWLRFLLTAVFLATVFAAGDALAARGPDLVSALSAVLVGIVLAAYLTYRGRRRCAAVRAAVVGLDGPRRAAALDAVLNGGAPADPAVRAAAARLGTAYLGGKSDAELERQERQTWIIFALLLLLGVYAAVLNRGNGGEYLLALVVLLAALLPIGVHTTRRIRRNTVHLGGAAPRRRGDTTSG